MTYNFIKNYFSSPLHVILAVNVFVFSVALSNIVIKEMLIRTACRYLMRFHFCRREVIKPNNLWNMFSNSQEVNRYLGEDFGPTISYFNLA